MNQVVQWLPLAAIILGGQGLLTVFAERRFKAAQVDSTVAGTALAVLNEMKSERNECHTVLSEAVQYIVGMRADMMNAGIKVRPLPPSLLAAVI